jgi:hypothetical protein
MLPDPDYGIHIAVAHGWVVTARIAALVCSVHTGLQTRTTIALFGGVHPIHQNPPPTYQHPGCPTRFTRAIAGVDARTYASATG